MTSHKRDHDLPAVLTATTATQSIVSWAALALPAIAPIVALSLGLSPVLIGYQISLIYLLATATSLISGALVARWGACRVSQLSLACCVAACLALAVPSIAAIALASMIIGVAYGLTNPAAAHLLARHSTSRNRSLVFSVKQSGVPIGGMAAGLITPSLALMWGWQVAVAAIAPCALVLIAALALRRTAWDADRDPSMPIGLGALRASRSVLGHPAIRWLCVYGLCYGAIQLCLMTFVVTWAMTELAFGAVLAGSLLAAIQASGIVGRLGWGYIADRVGNVAILVATGLIATLCTLAIAFLDESAALWLVFALTMLFGLSAVGWNGVFIAEVVRLAPPSLVGTAAGMATFSAFIGVLVGPLLFVKLHALLDSFAYAYGVLSVPALVGAIAAAISLRRHNDGDRSHERSGAP